MRRTIGFLFFYGGLAVIVVAWAIHNRPPMLVANHNLAPWVLAATIGVVLTLLGIVIAGPTRKR